MARVSRKTRAKSKAGGVNEAEGAVNAGSSRSRGDKPAIHESSEKFSSLNKILTVLLALSVVTIVYLYANLNKQADADKVTGAVVGVSNASKSSESTLAKPAGSYGTVKLDFYVMSQCPYGVQVEDAIKPVLDKLGDSVDFGLDYIATENAGGTFSSLHGQAEVDGDIIQLCAAKYYPSGYMDFIVCQNKDVSKIQNWNSCAVEAGLDAAKIETCFKGEEGRLLLSESIKASTAANARGSPTIYINGQSYTGQRDNLSFMRALCARLDKHPECASIPACGSDQDCTAEADKEGRCVNPSESDARCEYSDPVPVELVVLNAAECTTCNAASIISTSEKLFLGLRVRNVEYASEEGRSIYEKYNVNMLPAYLFDSNVTKSPSYVRVERALVKTGDRYLINPQAAGSNYNPTLVEIPLKLDLFVMSQCPYGVLAEQNLAEALELFGSSINFTLRYIANENADGTFTSLHGQAEVDEDLRQVCAAKYNPDEYFKYVLCVDENYTKAGSVWESCANKTGLDVAEMRACYTGEEGKKLLSENIKLSDELGVSSSPTFLINGKQQVRGVMTANAVKEYMCNTNAGLGGCDVNLSSGPNTQAAAGGCG